MEIDEDEFARVLAFIEQRERDAAAGERRQGARARLGQLDERIETTALAPHGRAADLDRRFAGMFLPSDMVRTQLRLACHYLRAADAGEAPTLPAFVILRVAIECIATAHWLMAAPAQHARVERFLKRMWWDAQSATELFQQFAAEQHAHRRPAS